MPTDKERLDWLEKSARGLHFPGLCVGRIQKMRWGLYHAGTLRSFTKTTARKCIDAAMRAEKGRGIPWSK